MTTKEPRNEEDVLTKKSFGIVRIKLGTNTSLLNAIRTTGYKSIVNVLNSLIGTTNIQ